MGHCPSEIKTGTLIFLARVGADKRALRHDCPDPGKYNRTNAREYQATDPPASRRWRQADGQIIQLLAQRLRNTSNKLVKMLQKQ